MKAEFSARLDRFAFDAWRYVYAIERGMVRFLVTKAKSEPDKQGPKALLEYYRLINDKLFFVPDVYDRLDGLYDAYRAHPKLSLGIARELAGGPFNCDGEDSRNPLIREAMLDGKHDLLQVCFYLEHRARLAVLETAVAMVAEPITPKTFTHDGRTFTELRSVPASFQRGLETLRGGTSFRQYPVFWLAAATDIRYPVRGREQLIEYRERPRDGGLARAEMPSTGAAGLAAAADARPVAPYCRAQTGVGRGLETHAEGADPINLEPRRFSWTLGSCFGERQPGKGGETAQILGA